MTGVCPVANIPVLISARFLRPEAEKAGVNPEICVIAGLGREWRHWGGAGTSFDPRRFY